MARWPLGYYELGRERSAGTFGRRRDANRAWRRAEAVVAEGRFVDVRSGRQRFTRYVVEVWLLNHVIEVNTRQGYVQTVERYLLPVFGSMRMNKILHVRDVVRTLQQQGVPAYAVQRCMSVLSGFFTTALHDRVIFLHPCTGVRVPTPPARPMQILTLDELEAILAVVPDKEWEEWRLPVEAAIGSGARWGELTELRVGDLDPVVKPAHRGARRRRDSTPVSPHGGRFLIKDHPKNKRYRRVKLDTTLVAPGSVHHQPQVARRRSVVSVPGKLPSRPVAGSAADWRDDRAEPGWTVLPARHTHRIRDGPMPLCTLLGGQRDFAFVHAVDLLAPASATARTSSTAVVPLPTETSAGLS